MAQSPRGFSVLEPLFAGSLLAIVALGVVSAITYTGSLRVEQTRASTAVFFAEEGLAAVRSMRDASFASLTVGTHGLATSSGAWIFTGTSDSPAEGFVRTVTVSSISSTSREIESSVAWSDDVGTSTRSLTTRLTNWRP